MTVRTGTVDRGSNRIGHMGKVRYVKGNVKKKKKYCGERRIKRSVPMVLQELFVSCREVFKGPGAVPLPSDVDKLCHILDNMKPEDVGLSGNLQFFKPNNPVKGSPRVTCTTIYKCDNFSLCIFFLPSTGVIPLHNHPGMTVFSKLLLGKMHIKSYDWVDPAKTDDSVAHSKKRLARLKADAVFKAPCSTSVLFPTTGGNIHSFTAITPCAVLDVIGPPYSMQDGRDCSYYKEHPYSSFPNGPTPTALTSEETEYYGWLEEIDMPENSQMDGIEYLGPQLKSKYLIRGTTQPYTVKTRGVLVPVSVHQVIRRIVDLPKEGKNDSFLLSEDNLLNSGLILRSNIPPRIQENIRRRREAVVASGATREPPTQRQRRVDQAPSVVPSVQFAPPQLMLDPLVTELDVVCRRLLETVLSDRERASNITTNEQAHCAALLSLAVERHDREMQQLHDERDAASNIATQALQASEMETTRLNESSIENQRLQA